MKRVRETNLILPAAHGQLEKSDLGLSDMDSGHVDGSISGPDPGPTSKINIRLASTINMLLNYWIIPEKSPKYIRVRGFPERDILSLRTLGLGLAQI